MPVVKFHQSLYSLLLTAFILVVLPIYAGGFLVYAWGVTQVKNEIVRTQAAQNRSYLNMLDLELRGLRSEQSGLLADRDIRLLAITGNSMSEIDRIFTMRRVQDHLRSLMDGSLAIQNVTLHVPALARSVHAVGSITELDPDYYRELGQLVGPAAGQIIFINGQPTLLMAYPQQYFEQRWVSAYMVEIVLSRQAMDRSLAIMAQGSGLALFSYRNRQLLATTPDGSAAAAAFLDQTAGQTLPLTGRYVHEATPYLVVVDYTSQSDIVLVGFLPEQRIYEPLRRFQPLFWVFTGAVVVLAALFYFLLDRLLHRPLHRLVESFRVLEDGQFDIHLDHRRQDEFRYLFGAFNTMVGKLRQLIDQVYKQTIYAQQAELKQLQSQISPHFLYNSFFTLQNMAESGDTENLASYSALIGQYFQYMTRNAQATASLADEVAHARIYATLQIRRFRNRLSLAFAALPLELSDEPVPRLILQPILENAFEHGLKNKLADGQLSVSFVVEADRLMIEVADNGDDITPDELRLLAERLEQPGAGWETTGLINVHRRLRLQDGPDSGLQLFPTPGGGLTVRMTIRRQKGG
jgi:two-component system sensor histidine kinase YesM